MTARLVAFLGLGAKGVKAPECYERIVYEWQGQPCQSSRIMASVLDELFGPFDEVVVLGTSQVREAWIDNGVLRSELGGRPLSFVEIPEGGSEGDPWVIFERTLAALGLRAHSDVPPGKPERVVFDLTHGFRAHPMIGITASMFAVSEWARKKEQAPELRMFYGAFPLKTGAGATPLWELTDLIAASKWNAAIDALVRYGRADDMEALGAIHGTRWRKAAQQAGAQGRELGKHEYVGRLGKAARSFADDLATGRARDLLRKGGSADGLKRLLKAPEAQDLRRRIPPLAESLDWLAARVEKLADRPLEGKGFVDAFRYLGGLYGDLQRFSEQAATIREGLVTAFGVYSGVRLQAPGVQGCKEGHLALDSEVGLLASEMRKRKEAEAEPVALGPAAAAVVALAGEVQDLRNDVEHLGLNDAPKPAETVRRCLEKLSLRFQSTDGETAGVFLNLSNHPISEWTKEQHDAACALGCGPPTELPEGMSVVPPTEDERSIQQRAEALAALAAKLKANGAHVAGDQTFSYALVRELLARGIRCFAATSHRDCQESRSEDGVITKTSTFRFVRWREYTRAI